jgi:hypothetical protein
MSKASGRTKQNLIPPLRDGDSLVGGQNDLIKQISGYHKMPFGHLLHNSIFVDLYFKNTIEP